MPVSERDRGRLEALIAIIRPENSIAARVERLNDEQRNYFECWDAQWKRFIARYPGGEAYRMTLDDYGPKLRDDIDIALFDPITRIEITDDENAAAEKYRKTMR